MTLATILLIGIFCVAPAASSTAASDSGLSAKQSDNSARPQSQGTQAQSAAPPTTPATGSQSPTPATTPAPQDQTRKTKRTRHKKKLTGSNCNNTVAANQGAAPSSAPAAGKPAAAASNAPAPCPPVKVVVKQGGTSASGIELAGGATGNQASNQRDAANQMLGTTESNLKKIAGQQLSSDQQDMVKQIRQFMEQSKAAAADGDLERARTLAWKAQVLSEELVKPAQ